MRRGIRSKATGTFVCALLLLQGCQSEEESTSEAATAAPQELVSDAELSGSVGDGPISGADLTVFSSDGEVLSRAVSSETAGYNIELKVKGKHYPLTIEARGGIDMVTMRPPGFTMRSASTEPRNKAVANISPFTTLAVALAERMTGGISSNNLPRALEIVLDQFNMGLTSALSLDPMTTPIDDSNLAEIVKASEMLAETLRRAGTLSGGASVDSVVAALAADLVDGVLDGRGGQGSDRRVAAATVLAASQVLVEAMRNELRVDDAVVTDRLDAVVLELASRGNAASTESRPVTSEMIAQARRGAQAALALTGDADVQALIAALDGLSGGMTAQAARGVLSAFSFSAFETSLARIVAGAEADLDVVLDGEPPPPVPPPPTNSAPTISGTPPSSVLQDVSYRFRPSASDADGDSLTFAIENRPAWASFDAATGELSGTPSAADVGIYTGVVISVDDGLDAARLPVFSIAVQAVELGSATLSWEAPTQNEDGSLLLDLAGYRVQWGTQSRSYTGSVQIDNPGVTTYVIENLSPGTYYFSATAINATGVESSLSNEASKTIP